MLHLVWFTKVAGVVTSQLANIIYKPEKSLSTILFLAGTLSKAQQWAGKYRVQKLIVRSCTPRLPSKPDQVPFCFEIVMDWGRKVEA